MQTRDINLQLFRKQMAVLRRFIWGAGQVTKSGWPIQKEGSKNCFIIVIDINIKTAVHLYFKYLFFIYTDIKSKMGGGGSWGNACSSGGRCSPLASCSSAPVVKKQKQKNFDIHSLFALDLFCKFEKKKKIHYSFCP